MGGDAGKSSVSWFWALSQRFWAGILDFPVWPVGRAGRGGVQGFALLVAFQQSFEHQSIRVRGYWGPLGDSASGLHRVRPHRPAVRGVQERARHVVDAGC